MTDFKPYAVEQQPQSPTISVEAGVFIPDDRHVEVGGWLEPVAETCLLDLALDCLLRTEQVEHRSLYCLSPKVEVWWKKHARDGVDLLHRPPPHELGSRDGPHVSGTHYLQLEVGFPLLRPSSLDELIRLSVVRGDDACWRSAVALGEPPVDDRGEACCDGGRRRVSNRLYRFVEAFSLRPVAARRTGRGCSRFVPFEISSSEAFYANTRLARAMVAVTL